MFLAGKNEIVAYRKLREDLQQLKSPAYAEPIEIAGPHSGRGPAVDPDFARGRPQLAENAIEQCGFS